MQTKDRRDLIIQKLKEADTPISATSLAKEFNVSRQIIVGDVALIRAMGEEITATPRGYIISSQQSSKPAAGLIKKIACVHSGEQMQTELNICIKNGCSVLDVIVEHPLYGQITGPLQLYSIQDVDQFIQKADNYKAHALSELTDGIHLHTLLCPDLASYERVCHALEDEGILLKSRD